jgi:serine/threonine protein kinase
VIGQVLGHCRVVAKIGEGGMGIVYRAYDEMLHRDVALKVVKKDAHLDSSSSQRLLHEARASSSLSHPNICTIHEVGENEGELFIVMELVEGKSLRAMCADAGLPPESVLRYGVQIASALARAHDRGIVHRDLKTANIVVTADGLVKILDFGLAKQVGSGIFDATTRSFASIQDASSMSGTLPYMAPEILRGEAADYRSDLWALGVVLYEAASGRLGLSIPQTNEKSRAQKRISQSSLKNVSGYLVKTATCGFCPNDFFHRVDASLASGHELRKAKCGGGDACKLCAAGVCC